MFQILASLFTKKVAAGLAVAGIGAQAFTTIEAGKAAEEAAERRAEEERIAAQTEELKRREELNRVLASNILSQATSGIASEATPASLALEQAKTIGESESLIALTNRLRQRNIIQSGRDARRSANLGAVSTLLKSSDDLQAAFKTLADNKGDQEGPE